MSEYSSQGFGAGQPNPPGDQPGSTGNGHDGNWDEFPGGRRGNWDEFLSDPLPPLPPPAPPKPQPVDDPSFRDPWAEPPAPEWPADILPVKYHDMLYELSIRGGLDPGAQGVGILCGVSGAAPKNTRFYPYGMDQNWWVPPIIWGMVLQKSGQRKTALNNPFSSLQRKHKKLWDEYEHKRRAWYALPKTEQNKRPKPPEPHSFIMGNTTPEKVQMALSRTDRGTMLLYDELAAFLAFGRYAKDGGLSERAFYIESYEGRPYTVHRVTRDSFQIAVNGLTIFGLIQPERLKKFPDLQDDGLLQRFITYRAAPAVPGKKLDGEITGKEEFDAVIERLAELFGHEYRTTNEGSDVIRRMEADGVEYAGFTDYGEGFSGFCGKLHGTVARLALILHLLKDPAPDSRLIHPDTVLAADRLVRKFVLPCAVNFYATLFPDRIDLTRDIAAWLLTSAPQRVRASDFGRHLRACRGLDGKALMQALDPLVTGGWLSPEDPFPSNRVWHLDPQVRTVMSHRVAEATARREELRTLFKRIMTDMQS
jgi:hypothetical protein